MRLARAIQSMPQRVFGAFVLLAAGGAAVAAAPEGQTTYEVSLVDSRVTIHLGRAGIFGFVGHEHEIEAPVASGTVMVDAQNQAGSSVALSFDAASLRVTGKGEPPQDVPKVQARMLGPDVLDVARFPKIDFASTGAAPKRVSEGSYDLLLSGRLTLHGVTRDVRVPARVEIREGRLRAQGKTTFRQSEFGISPVSVGGVVKVKDAVVLEFDVVASVPQPTP